MKKILITGGAGFVGRQLVKASKNIYEVHMVDNLLSGESRLDEMDTGTFFFYKEDLTNKDRVSEIISKVNPDILIHLAAIHFIPLCEKNPHLATTTNIISTINLLENINKEAKFIFISSAAVYSPTSTSLVEEVSDEGPLDLYGHTKLHGEHYVKLFSKKRDLNATIVRLFNVIGPGETNPHILPEIINQLKEGKRELNLGNIDSKRDFIDVNDVAKGLLKICEIDSLKVGLPLIVNLGSGKTFSMSEIIKFIREISGKDFKILKDPSKIRRLDNPIILASTKKLEKITNWIPETPIKETLKNTWESDEIFSFF